MPLATSLAALLACAVGFPATAETRYHVIRIDPAPGYDPFPDVFAINDAGEVAGSADGPPGGGRPAFRWHIETGMIILGDLPGGGNSTMTQAINELGHVAGMGIPAYALNEAFRWTPENGIEPLGDLPGGAGSQPYYSWAYGMNDVDQVVGLSKSANGNEAFLWDPNTGMVGLGDFPGEPFVSVAFDINNSGQVVGMGSGTPGGPFIWEAATGLVPLNTGPGLQMSYVFAINEAGVIAGYCTNGDACVWSKQTGAVSYGAVPGAFGTFAQAINDLDEVVGWAYMGTFADELAFIADAENGVRLLDDYLDASSQVYKPLGEPRGINDNGQIVVQHSLLGIVLQPYVPGDSNCDDVVNLQDIKPLLEFIATFDPNATPTSYCGWWTADVNQDATLDEKDVTAMWELLGLSCGDLNSDGFVDQSDVGILLGDFGCTAGLGECVGDADADGDTDQSDLGILLANYGGTCP
jgi:probable HAF family extracellular repeat protein